MILEGQECLRLCHRVHAVIQRLLHVLCDALCPSVDVLIHCCRGCLPNSPPHVAEMKAFEDDLVKMMENVKFRRVNGPFQNDLREKARSISKSDKVIVKADKTSNLCFGFKSRNSPPHVAEIKAFEDDLVKMMENVKFRRVNGPFQNNLREKAKPRPTAT